MARAQITVVADSQSLRESVDVALGSRHALTFSSSLHVRRSPRALSGADLVVAEFAVAAALCGTARRVLWVVPARLARGAPQRSLLFPFRPEQLRAAVNAALAEAPVRPSATALDVPLIPARAATIAAVAGRCRLPVLISGERGTGKRRLAHQVHKYGGGGPIEAIDAADLPRYAAASAATPTAATLVIRNLQQLCAAGAATLGGWVEASGGSHEPPRLLLLSEVDADALAAPGVVDHDLFYRLTVLPIHLPPLRDRAEELPAIAMAVLQHTCSVHAIEPAPPLTAAAVERLARYPWPGNLTELEAVLTRSALLCREESIDVADIVFDAAAYDAKPLREIEAAAIEGAAANVVDALGVMIQELAHELKNPMVAIKTAAQLLARSGGAADDPQEAAELAGDAVDRMDRVVENLLQFARFDGVHREDVALADVLGPALDMVERELHLRQIHLDDRIDGRRRVWADAAQTTYAFANLLQAALRAAGDGAPMALRQGGDDTLRIEFPATNASIAATLAKWSDAPSAMPSLESSIHWVFARALIERNQGTLAIDKGDGTTTLRVTLPSPPGARV